MKANYKSEIAKRDLAKWITNERIRAAGEGYYAAVNEIAHMIREEGKTLEDILNYCDLITNSNSEVIDSVTEAEV